MKYEQATPTTSEEITGWFIGAIPQGLFTKPPKVEGDDDEILIVGEIPDVEVPKDASEATKASARSARIGRFRQETRQQRIDVALEAERLFDRKVSWGVECGGVRELFTTLGVPVMTRLRLQDRQVLDTFIDAGVARSRSEALAWCVRLVGKHQSEWIENLRDALTHVEKVRAQGPDA
jgi:hypothetical protein